MNNAKDQTTIRLYFPTLLTVSEHTIYGQAWDWVLHIKSEICLSSGAAVSLLGGFGGKLPQEIFFNRYSLLHLEALKYICIVLKKIKKIDFFKENYYIMILVARCMIDLYHFISKILPIPGNTVKLFHYLI